VGYLAAHWKRYGLSALEVIKSLTGDGAWQVKVVLVFFLRLVPHKFAFDAGTLQNPNKTNWGHVTRFVARDE
jgi:hypothetical protein